MEQQHQTPATWVDLGAWVGRQQALAVIANKCSSAQALALKQMKETGAHLQLDLTWEEFCPLHIGLCSKQADRIIGQYNEFGEAYFRLSTLARINADEYRALAPSIEENFLQIDGENVAIVPENAPRIRAFVRAQRARRRAALPESTEALIVRFKSRHRELVEAISRRIRGGLPSSQREAWNRLIQVASEDWEAIDRIVNERH